MATELFIWRRCDVLVEALGLTLADTEETIKKSIEAGLAGWSPDQNITLGSDDYAHQAGKPIFPKWVYLPDEEGVEENGRQRWLKRPDPFGQGPNEDFEYLMKVIKKIIMRKEGLSRCSWEMAKKYSREELVKIHVGLEKTNSGRGPRSPYTQDYDKELELALEFGIDTVLRWHESMHFKGWAEFVNDIYGLWLKWGREVILEIDRVCGKRIRWFARFAPPDYDGNCKFSTHIEALRAWKRANWIHAVTKINSQEASELDQELGERTVNDVVRENTEKLASLDESLRPAAIRCLAEKDTVDWFRDWRNLGSSSVVNGIINLATKSRMKPSAMAAEVAGVCESGLGWNSIYSLSQDIYWLFIKAIAKKFRELLVEIVPENREKAMRLLFDSQNRNTRWWPQATDEQEFNAGATAEKIGREGLEGIQRARWLKDHLGKDWIPRVDELLNWEESAEIIKKNPWIKTSLWFVDKEQTILDIAAGKDVAYLKYVATQTELDATAKVDSFSTKKAEIKSTWPVDIQGWFGKLSIAVGEQLAWDYIGNRSRHDQLFFVEAMLEKLSVKTLGYILSQVRSDFVRFGQAINAFVQTGELEFQSFKEFIKTAELQKSQIVFPPDAPEILRERVQEMLTAPGIDVNAVKMFADRKNWPLICGQEDSQAVFSAEKLEIPAEPLESILRWALGKPNPSCPEEMAQAEKPALLFRKLNALAKKIGLKGAAELVKNVPEQIETEVMELLREHKVNLGKVYTAEVAAKSDPRGWTCGDWTNCCMQFGAEKNNEYMRRRDMSYFLVSVEDRVIAQSVVVAAAHVSRNGTAPKVAEASVSNIDAIGLDNVEVAPNFRTHNPMIEAAYRKFWRHYTRKFGKSWQIIIGMSHNDARPASRQVAMEWKPLERMVYSDCFGNSQAYLLVEPEKTKRR